MPTSRIVQAHGTIQLFVQRCLMGLEPRSVANIKHDSGWDAVEVDGELPRLGGQPQDLPLSGELDRARAARRQVVAVPGARERAAAERADRPRRGRRRDRLPREAGRHRVPGSDGQLLPDRHPHHARLRADQGRRSRDLLLPAVPAGALLDALGEGGPGHHRRSPAGVRPQQPPDPGVAGLHAEADDPTDDARTQSRADIHAGRKATEKPRKRWKIQLAISERAGTKWLPKKISKDALYSPALGYFLEPPAAGDLQLLCLEPRAAGQAVSCSNVGGSGCDRLVRADRLQGLPGADAGRQASGWTSCRSSKTPSCARSGSPS